MAAIALASASACKKSADPRQVTVHDGNVCLGVAPDAGGASGGVVLEAGQPLAISVRSACLSNVCATARSSSCAVKRDGNRLVVTSELTWIGPEDLGRPCPADCTFLEARCTTEVLPAGDYTIVVGGRGIDVTLPSRLPVRCERDAPSVAPLTVLADAAPKAAATATPAAALEASATPAAPGTGIASEAPPRDTVCIGPGVANKNRALKAGQPVALTILHRNVCSAASCTRAPGKCTAKRKGFDIVVSTQFPSSTTRPTQPCTEDCTAIAATCRTDALPSGTYAIQIGAQKKTLQIPSPSAPPCGP